MTKILLLGSTGQVGHHLLETVPDTLEILAPSRSECDISEYKTLSDYWDIHQDITLIINAAAYTDVSGAEIHVDQANAVNSKGVGNIARQCRLKNIPLIHLSTDYVFDGKKHDGYCETDPVRPINTYGKSKAEGESILARQLENFIVLRTSWIFGPYGKNFLKTIWSMAREKQALEIVKDQIGSPTPSKSLAEAIWIIAQKIFEERQSVEWGVYHYAGTPSVSWYDFACSIVDKEKEQGACPPSVKVVPITSDKYNSLVTRPQNSVLNCDKIKRNFGIDQPEWKDAILSPSA